MCVWSTLGSGNPITHFELKFAVAMITVRVGPLMIQARMETLIGLDEMSVCRPVIGQLLPSLCTHWLKVLECQAFKTLISLCFTN